MQHHSTIIKPDNFSKQQRKRSKNDPIKLGKLPIRLLMLINITIGFKVVLLVTHV